MGAGGRSTATLALDKLVDEALCAQRLILRLRSRA
jgi:hypothetical protein